MFGCARTSTDNRSTPGGTQSVRSIGQDTYNRLLEVQVSDLAHKYQVIPITVQITNLEPQEPPDADVPSKHPTAQLFPHFAVWIEENSKLMTERITLPIENRIWFKQDETFERSVDLSTVEILSAPGEYVVSIGHENDVITDLGDWTGTLRSRSQTIVIKEKE
jgi:hypothetical protein